MLKLPKPRPRPPALRSAGPLPEDSIVRHYELVDSCFGKGTVEEIDAALAEAAGRLGAESAAGALCGRLLGELRKVSPTSLKARGGGAAPQHSGDARDVVHIRYGQTPLASAARRHTHTTPLLTPPPTLLLAPQVGLQMFRAHRGKQLRDVLIADQRVAVRMLRGKDFHEVGGSPALPSTPHTLHTLHRAPTRA